jgi:hypothetical protein
MNINRTEGLFTFAEELLIAAEHEQERAQEDVVSHLICANSRQSISNFLAGFLLRKNIPIEHPVSMASLREQCIAVDARFEMLDFTRFNCRWDNHDRNYCLEQDIVNECLKTAQHVRAIVTAETPGY